MPKVSVCVPCFNVSRYVNDALDSIMAQTFQDFEVIVVDDGSTDGSPNLVIPYCAKDKRVSMKVRATNGGEERQRRDIGVRDGEFAAGEAGVFDGEAGR